MRICLALCVFFSFCNNNYRTAPVLTGGNSKNKLLLVRVSAVKYNHICDVVYFAMRTKSKRKPPSRPLSWSSDCEWRMIAHLRPLLSCMNALIFFPTCNAVEDFPVVKDAPARRHKQKKNRRKKSRSNNNDKRKRPCKKKVKRIRRLVKIAGGKKGEPDVYRLTSLVGDEVVRLCDTTDPEDSDRTTDSSPHFVSPRKKTDPPQKSDSLVVQEETESPPENSSFPWSACDPPSDSFRSPNLLSPKETPRVRDLVDRTSPPDYLLRLINRNVSVENPSSTVEGDAQMHNRRIPSPVQVIAPVDTPAVSVGGTPATVVDTPDDDVCAATKEESTITTPRTPFVVRPPPKRLQVRRSLRLELAQTRLRKDHLVVSASKVRNTLCPKPLP